MIVSISLSKEEEQLFKNYAEFVGVDLSTLFKTSAIRKNWIRAGFEHDCWIWKRKSKWYVEAV